jgi:hypothetical protein
MRWAGHVILMGEWKSACRIVRVNPQGRRPLWRPWHGNENNIKTDY